MRRFSHQVIYQLGLAVCLFICTVMAFLNMYKLECPLTDGTTEHFNGKMVDYSRGYILLIVLALVIGVFAEFVYFNKWLIIASGVLVIGVGLRFMTFADSSRGQVKLADTKGIITSDLLGEVLDKLSGTPMAIKSQFTGEFTFAFYGYMIFAIGALAFAVMSAMFINKDSYGY